MITKVYMRVTTIRIFWRCSDSSHWLTPKSSITAFWWWDDEFVAAAHRDKGVALRLNQPVIYYVRPESALETDDWSWHLQILWPTNAARALAQRSEELN